MDLVDAFALGPKELVVVFGGGARRTLLHALARNVALGGRRAVVTSTTELAVPRPDECDQVLADPNPEIVYRDLIERLKYFPHVTVGLGGRGGYVTLRGEDAGHRLRGLPVHLVHAIHRNPSIAVVLVDADPPSGEKPGIPAETTLVVPVLETSYDVDTVTEARLEAVPSRARIVPFVVVGSEADARVRGRELARALLSRAKRRGVRTVVLGTSKPFAVLETVGEVQAG